MAFDTTDGLLYITEVDPPFESLRLQFVPNDFTWNRQGNYSEVVVVGRNHPRYHFIGGKDTIGIQLDFYSDEEGRDDVYRKVRWLQSLIYNDGSFGHVKHIKLTFGDMFKGQQWVVKSANAKMSHFNKFYGMMPQRALVDLVLDQDVVNNLTRADVRRN